MYSLARHTFWVLGTTVLLASFALVGCGSKDGGGPPPVAPGIVVPASTSYGTGSGGVMSAQDVTVTNGKTFELFLQNYGLCSAWMNYSIGDRACSTYTSAAYVAIQVTGAGPGTLPTALMVSVGAGAPNRWTPNSSFWTKRVLTPTFNTAVSPTNADQGFTAVGPYGVRLVVQNGFPGTAPLNFELVYSGTVFLRGTLIPQ